MALRYYHNSETGETKASLKRLESPWTEVISAPSSKFMVKANLATGRSKLKDADKILRARARNHSRDVGLDDLIHVNRVNGLEDKVKLNLLNEKGERRKKIDDL